MVNITLDPWQKEFLATEGDKILCCGRQVGKSVICGMDAGEWAVKHPNQVVLIISATERQAYALFLKAFNYVSDKYPQKIKKGKDKPTKHKFTITNNTEIWSLPTGLSGTGIRFLTVGRLYADESSRIPDEVFIAVTPMLLTTGGDTIYLSTPASCEGEFYDCWTNKDGAYNSFKRFSVESETVLKERKICSTWTVKQKEKALQKIEQARARFTASRFSQEYLGKYVESLVQFFPTELIKEAMVIDRKEPRIHRPVEAGVNNYLGVDVARMGGDENVLLSVERIKRERIRQIDMEISTTNRITDTFRQIVASKQKHNHKKIYIDDGGLGVGVFDMLLEHEQTRRRVIAINNASRSLDRDEHHRKRLLKEDLYANLLRLMEQGKVELFKDPEILLSLKSVQYESKEGRMKIFGRYTHIAEALIRAAWCMQDKSLNIWVR